MRKQSRELGAFIIVFFLFASIEQMRRLKSFVPSSPVGNKMTMGLQMFFGLNASDEGVDTRHETDRPASQQEYCLHLKNTLGFWSEYQCTLWRLIEDNVTIDMTPYLAKNLLPGEKFWSSTPGETPGSGRNSRIIYHLHLHKCMGSTFCNYFKQARVAGHAKNGTATGVPLPPIGTRGSVRETANSKNNCNVPDGWWWNESQPELHFQHGAYIGATRQKMKSVYEKIKNRGWIYVASEGSLEDEPIFGKEGPYYYSTILRDPIPWIISMWHYDDAFSGKQRSLDDYLTKGLWSTPDFFTRRICGVSCVRAHALTMNQFLRAKSMLDHFDLVMVQEIAVNSAATMMILKSEFPCLSSPALQKHNAGKYSKHNFTSFQLDYMQNQTLMDKVLYEYAKVLHKRKLDSLLVGGSTDASLLEC